MMLRKQELASTPIAAGEQQLTVTLTVTLELE
jgi:hypothetical protein